MVYEICAKTFMKGTFVTGSGKSRQKSQMIKQ